MHEQQLELQPSQHDWRHLPADMIFIIASYLDARSLARLNRTEKLTHTVITKRSHVLWRALAQNTEVKTGWMTAEQRTRLIQFEQNDSQLKQRNPQHYFFERAKLIQGFHHHLMALQQHRLHCGPNQKFSLATRWYDGVILPICLLFLLALFVSLLVYQLSTNDGRVGWMTMAPFLIFCSLLTVSIGILTFIRIRARAHSSQYEVPKREQTSFFNMIVDIFVYAGPPDHRTPSRSLLVMIMLALLINAVLLSLRVTGTVDWAWPVIFLPFFLSVVLIAVTLCLESYPREQRPLIPILLLVLSPLIIFILLLLIYLNNGGSTSSLQLRYVFIPLYLVDALTFLFCLFFPLMYPAESSCRYPLLRACVPWIIWIGVFGPLLYLKIVLGLRADSNGKMITSNFALFLPLLATVLTLSCGLIALMVHCGVFQELKERSEEIDRELRTAIQELRIPQTVEEIENDPRYMVRE